jgi:hypothetical protein
VFTALGDGALSGDELRSRIGIHERAARDFFDALVALRLRERDGDAYSNAPDVDAFLDKREPGTPAGS